jgi:hypothetical protein
MAGGIMLAALSFSFTHLTEGSTVIPPDEKIPNRGPPSKTIPR